MTSQPAVGDGDQRVHGTKGTCILRSVRYFALVFFQTFCYGATSRWAERRSFLRRVCLLANGLIGERGLTETIRARRVYSEGLRDLARLRRENATLRETVRRLRDDPATLESAARRDLGLVRPNEILISIRDVTR